MHPAKSSSVRQAVGLTLVALLAIGVTLGGEPMGAVSNGGDIPHNFTPNRADFDYLKRDVMIPMRDGVKLHTVIVIPNAIERGPILLDRTPYSADRFTDNDGSPVLGNVPWPTYRELARVGYIIVIQDVRGSSAQRATMC